MSKAKSRSPTGGFFLRVLGALVLVNLGTAAVLIFIAYKFSTDSITNQAQESISQQVSVYGEALENRLLNAQKIIKALENSQDMGDFLYGSIAERLILARRIERRFIQVQQDNTNIMGIYFYDEDGEINIGVRDKRRLIMSREKLIEDEGELQTEARILFKKMQETLLLVSSGNMEWFVPPKEATISGPFKRQDGGYTLLVGLAKLDINSGIFGGMLLLHFNLDNWFQDLARIRIHDHSPVWVFNDNGDILLKPGNGSSVTELLDFSELLPTVRSWETQLVKSDMGLVAYRDIPLLQPQHSLRLSFGLPRQLMLQGLEPAFEFFTWVLIVSMILLIGVSYFISNFLVTPFLQLAVARNNLVTAQRMAKLGHWEWDQSGNNLRLSENAIEILDFEQDDTHIDFDQLLTKVDKGSRENLEELVDRAVQQGKSGSVEYRLRLPNGKEQFIHHVIDVIHDDQFRVVGTLQDITERRQAEEKIRELAYHDSVTGLANRTRLGEIAQTALQLARFQNNKLAIIFLDLDQFKRVNDTLGHEAGDELLREVAGRLLETLRLSDSVSTLPEKVNNIMSVARLGGDEFVIVLPDLSDVDDAIKVASRINIVLSKPFQIRGKSIHSGGSLGVSIFPDHGDSIVELLRHADAAMYQAKALGRNRVELYRPEIDALQQKRLTIEAGLHRALENDEFELFYQPRFSIDGEAILSFEALLRWRDPEKGWVMPNDFIYIAEENGLIIPIGAWVMQEACRQLALWQKAYDDSLGMSINLSPAQFLADDLVASMSNAILKSNLSPDTVELELTENALFKDIDAGVLIANELRKLDLKLSIDDFGTGYSSLRLLRRLPVSTLKIDQSFVRDMLKDRQDALIVESFIVLGHNLGLKIVAEGVEEIGQWRALQELGCDELQGYYFGKPCSADDMTQLLQERSDRARTRAVNAGV